MFIVVTCWTSALFDVFPTMLVSPPLPSAVMTVVTPWFGITTVVVFDWPGLTMVVTGDVLGGATICVMLDDLPLPEDVFVVLTPF